MKQKIINSDSEQRRIVVHLDSVQARLASLPALWTSGRLQSQTQEELDALLPSILEKAFKGEL